MSREEARTWLLRGRNVAELSRGADTKREYEEHHGKAAKYYEEATRCDPTLAEAWLELGRARATLDSHEQALEAFAEGLRVTPDDADLWGGRARSCAALARYGDVVEACDQAQRGSPDDPKIADLRVDALARLGRHAEALEACEAILARGREGWPRGLLPWERRELVLSWHRGRALAGLGRSSEARAAFSAALALQRREWTWGKSELYQALAACEEARAAYAEELATASDTVRKWVGAGDTYEKAGLHSEALSAYSEATRLGDDPGAWYGLGDALLQADRYAEALSAYERALRHWPDRPPLVERVAKVRAQLEGRDEPSGGD